MNVPCQHLPPPEAVVDDPQGRVLVASNGYVDVSMGVGTKLMRLQRHGLAGVLTDGRLRDFDELAGYDFAAYCAGDEPSETSLRQERTIR